MPHRERVDKSQFSLAAILVATVVVSLWLGVVQFFPDPPVAGFVPLLVGLACYLFRDSFLLIAAPGLMAFVLGFYFHPGAGTLDAHRVDLVLFAITCAVTVIVCSITWTKQMESRRLASGTQCFVVATVIGSLIGVSISLAGLLWAVVLLFSGQIKDPQRVFFLVSPLFSAFVLAGYLFSIPIGIFSGLVCAMLPESETEGL